MKQSTIITAYKAVENIRKDINEKKNVTSKVSHIFYRLYKLLQPQYDFQVEEEQKIFGKYNPEVTEDGMMYFASDEDAAECMKELNALADLDVDLQFDKIDFKVDESSYLTPDEMIALDEFLNYIEE